MKFNDHDDLEGLHAFLSPSGYHWINYDETKLVERFKTYKATLLGTQLHEFASEAIKHKIRLADRKQAINAFVNDCIGFRMDSERVLYYSPNCFGTADAISFKEAEKKLMIFDLKTGKTRASYSQLDVYAALFCLEYGYSPHDILIEERIYQGSGYTENYPIPDHIRRIMDKIIEYDKLIEKLKLEEV